MTYTLELNLDTKGFEDYLEKRFKYGYKLKREVTNYFNRQEHRRRQSDKYRQLADNQKELSQMQERLQETADKTKKRLLKAQIKDFSEIQKKGWIDLNNEFKLGNGKFVRYKELGQASNMFERYSEEGIINWSTFEDITQTVKGAYLKRRSQPESDNTLKVQRYLDFKTLWYRKCNQNITEEGVFFGTRKNKVMIPWEMRKDDDIKLSYALAMQRLALYGLKRTLLSGGKYKYSILMVFDGEPYGVDTALSQSGKVTITVNVEEMTLEATNIEGKGTVAFDLANDFGYSEKLKNLDRKIENSRRLSNPKNYNVNGTIKEGRHQWQYSKNYFQLLDKKRKLWHKITKSRKNRFGMMANGIISLGDEFIVRKEDFKSLQKRKDYDPQNMNWTDKRKQKGFEIMFNAPNELIQVLKIKLGYKGLTLTEIVGEKDDK